MRDCSDKEKNSEASNDVHLIEYREYHYDTKNDW